MLLQKNNLLKLKKKKNKIKNWLNIIYIFYILKFLITSE